MKKYLEHNIIRYDGDLSRNYIINGDYCKNCKATISELYNYMSFESKENFKYLKKLFFSFEREISFINKYSIKCEEYVIKNIIE